MTVHHTIYDELNNMSTNSKCSNYENMYRLLIAKYPESIVRFVMDDEFGYIHTETEKRLTRTDTRFKSDVRKRYDGRCIVSGVSATTQVCHIKPFSDCTEDEKYDTNNGILLRDDLHTLFDQHNIWIEPDTLIVRISDHIMNNPSDNCYHCFNGMVTNINEQSKKYLRKKYE